MSELIRVPDIGGGEGEVIELMVKVGDRIEADQSVLTLESDKASMEIPAPKAGVVKSLKVKLGDRLKEGDELLELEVEGAAEAAPAAPAAAPAEAPKAAAAPAPAAAAPAPARAGGSDANAAPVYRGPSVRVTRGKETEDTQVSAKANGTAILSGQSSGVRRAGQKLPSAGATVIN